MNTNSQKEKSVISRFNQRDSGAFCELYLAYYDEMFHFTSRLFYHTTSCAEDILHDVFLTIWSSDTRFESEEHLKGYAYLSIRNKYKNLMQHKDSCDKYELHLKEIDEYQDSLLIETESLSILDQAYNLLPSECSKVLRLYIEGWSGAEIAIKLNKSINTVYAQKQTAINILRKKLSKKSLSILLIFLK